MKTYIISITLRKLDKKLLSMQYLDGYYSEKRDLFADRYHATHYKSREEAETQALLLVSRDPQYLGLIRIVEDDSANAFFGARSK